MILRESIADRVARGGELDVEERSQLREEIERAYGRYTPHAHELNELDREAGEAAGDEPKPAGEGALGAEAP